MKKVIGIVLILIIMLVALTGCTSEGQAYSSDRFKKILDEGTYEMICDTKTKVLYLQSTIGGGYQGYGGLTLLVDADGKPLLYEGE